MATYTWPIPFASATSYVIATSSLGGSSNATTTISIRNQVYNKTAGGFSAYNTSIAVDGCDYIAIGY